MQRAIQIAGVFVFFVATAVTIVFASGYQYDPLTRSLVKKGIIFFEKKTVKEIVLDGTLTEVAYPGEVRVLPGVHDITLNKDGYEPWHKKVTVPENEVVKFKEIKLFPLTGSLFEFIPITQMSGSEKIFISDDALSVYYPTLHVIKTISLEKKISLEIKDVTPQHEVEEMLAGQKLWRESAWTSQAGNTYHIIMVTAAGDAQFCDEDGENCHTFAHDTAMITSSKNYEVFAARIGTTLTLFHFEDDSRLPKFLRSVVGVVF